MYKVYLQAEKAFGRKWSWTFPSKYEVVKRHHDLNLIANIQKFYSHDSRLIGVVAHVRVSKTRLTSGINSGRNNIPACYWWVESRRNAFNQGSSHPPTWQDKTKAQHSRCIQEEEQVASFLLTDHKTKAKHSRSRYREEDKPPTLPDHKPKAKYSQAHRRGQAATFNRTRQRSSVR